MTENNGSKVDEEKSAGPTIYKSEDQIYQKLCLCDCLRELCEAAEEENEHSADKRKKLPTPAK